MTTQPPKLITMIQDLIALPSISSVSPAFDQGNRKVIDRLAEWLDGLGFETEIQVLSPSGHKANLIATLGRGPEGLVLAGHTDTVPYDEGRWQHDPFAMTEDQNRLYGLGTSDMKSFLAIAIEAARQYRPQDLKHPIIILATADEESSMIGAQSLVDAKSRLGRYAVIGEPTGMRPIRLHKGILMEAIRIRGASGHSSDPSLGRNALEGMHRVLGELLDWREELQRTYRNPMFEVPVPTLNLGHIHGGDNPNRICAQCELHIDIRPLPGMDLDDLRLTMSRRLEQCLADTGLELELEPLFAGTPAMETDAGSAIVQAAEQLTGHTSAAVAFGTEGPYLNEMGMDTIILGPGDIDQAHQPDEYLALDRIPPTLEILHGLIRRFCL